MGSQEEKKVHPNSSKHPLILIFSAREPQKQVKPPQVLPVRNLSAAISKRAASVCALAQVLSSWRAEVPHQITDAPLIRGLPPHWQNCISVMYVLLTDEQLIPNLTPDSHNAVTPEYEPRFTTLVTPLMAFISNFSRVRYSFFPRGITDNKLWLWVRIQLKSEIIVIWRWTLSASDRQLWERRWEGKAEEVEMGGGSHDEAARPGGLLESGDPEFNGADSSSSRLDGEPSRSDSSAAVLSV